ncbi:hypothetical protein DEU56DRAFT_913853 [Suillus clintonianus]|uniref:uncharacterized protein n=1 Tax=Suillus clintonianus TaxID=1904413 RepID=UPI001B87B05D|nr:uncharacterized protein DEU56DRAFT_913853 [Suillus clintonianus]KAG2133736.1 hypothetical protein DEU56DRAFT_913853 [Suillus clintonianus]
MSASATDNPTPLSSAPASLKSVDAGTLELGVESAWTRDNTFVTGETGSESVRAEPPTNGHSTLLDIDQLPSGTIPGAFDVPPVNRPLSVADKDKLEKHSPSIRGGASSVAMSLSPPLGQPDVAYPKIGLLDSLQYQRARVANPEIRAHTPRLTEVFDWADSPNDEELGEVPEFPTQAPNRDQRNAVSATSTPRIATELKGKEVDPLEKNKGTNTNPPKDWLAQWSEFDEGMAEANCPGPDDSDESLKNLWDDENRRGSIQIQNLALRRFRKIARDELNDQANVVDELRERVRELEILVIQSQTREDEARKQVSEAHRAPTISIQQMTDEKRGPPAPEMNSQRTGKHPVNLGGKPPAESLHRFQRASSVLPAGSSVKRAMTGPLHDANDPGPDDSQSSSDSSSDDDEESSTESDEVSKPPKGKRQRERSPRTKALTPEFGVDFLAMEPESEHDSDSADTKRLKRRARREYRAKLNLLKYQQGFIKNEPPFIYNGEANATTFKKWVREVREWKDRAQLTTGQSLRMLGKYLSGQAYRFFERDILDLRKGYSLTEFFEQLFDYVFPPDFRMQQRQRFLDCRQDGKQSVRDYLRRLRDLADMAGDVDDREIVRQFWTNCKPYLKASLVDKGYEPNTVSLEVIEKKTLRTERAFIENSRDPSILLALNPTAAASVINQPSGYERRAGRDRDQPHRRRDRRERTSSLSANAISNSRPHQPKPRSSNPSHPVHDRPKKSADEIRRLRERDLCFECEQKGHMAKDCPRRHKLPYRPGTKLDSLRSSAVGVTSADIRTAAIEEGVVRGLYGMAIQVSTNPELDDARHSLVVERSLALLRLAVPLPTDELVDPIYDPFALDRFTLDHWGGPDTYLLSDKHNYDSYIVYYDQLS